MTLAQIYSWIFYATGLASQTLPTTFAGVKDVADGINHAIPTQKEMRVSLSWAVAQGLVVKEGKKLKLSEDGFAILNVAGAASSTTSGVWKYLEKRFEASGVNNSLQVNPNTMNAE